ncbi:hypothetical protein C8Q74DRAFT_1247520 [Fomes fomentarius]|nr:hypothetical protein C8Q74DRAFT_1247520 [Fomes fomentarius]
MFLSSRVYLTSIDLADFEHHEFFTFAYSLPQGRSSLMFPLNDFNFVACALATFSAAVGYNVSRRRGRQQQQQSTGRLGFLKFHRRNSTASARSSSIAPTESECDGTEPPASTYDTLVYTADIDESMQLSDEVEDGSLKRKRSPTPEVAVSDTPPSKRRRTPPAARDQKHEIEESQVVGEVEDNTPPLATCNDNLRQGRDDQLSVPVPPDSDILDLKAEQQIVSVSTADEPTLKSFSVNPTTSPVGVTGHSVGDAAHPSSPMAPLSAWHSTNTIIAAKPSSAFQAFSGKPSAFANSSSSVASQKTPIWSTSTPTYGNSSGMFGETPTLAFSDADLSPLAASTRSASAQKVATVTGEEDEDVANELKGAKVFIKRGERDFCEGILGNVRLLKHKDTGAERILFRREPVWKVTMSVRLRPTVLCSFDEAQGALRVTLKEPVEDTQQERLVIYALRRGKASRAEFAEFARAVVESARVHEQARV